MIQKKILVVDDDEDIIAVIQTLLENEGFIVITAYNKNEGIAKVKTEKPDMIILDVMMRTQYEGFEMAKDISEDIEFKKIPILIQTSVEVFSSQIPDVIGMAREYRKNPFNKELEVLLIEDKQSGTCGIDYRTENGETIWVQVNGFVRKPVDSKKLLPAIKKFLK